MISEIFPSGNMSSRDRFILFGCLMGLTYFYFKESQRAEGLSHELKKYQISEFLRSLDDYKKQKEQS